MAAITTDAPDGLEHLEDTTTFFNGDYTARSVAVTICCAIAIYNSLELLLLIFTTFRRYGGLYFTSIVVATTGIVPYTVGFMIEYFTLTDQLAGEIISTVGWPMVVTGQSVVLYSRLGVVLGPSYQNLLKIVKWIIIVNGVVLHVSTSVVMFGAYNATPNKTWADGYRYIESVQMTIFTVQEFILSGIYIWRATDILRTATSDRKPKRIMRELLAINILIVMMDISLLVIQYQHRRVLSQTLKVLIYSIKLKLEFAILNKLINISQRNNNEWYLKPQDTSDVEHGGRQDSAFQRVESDCTGWLKEFEKPEAQHIERSASTMSETVYNGGRDTSMMSMGRVETIDSQRRRHNIETDDYAAACRDVAG